MASILLILAAFAGVVGYMVHGFWAVGKKISEHGWRE